VTDRPSLDVAALLRALRDRVEDQVDAGPGARALYSADASNYRQVPLAVVTPRSIDDVVATIATCAQHGAPVLTRGGGTAMAGQSTNTAVVVDFSRHLNGILAVDADARSARVQPGCVLDRLREAAGEHGLTFGPDPATHDHCTLGGMIGNDSCGVHSVVAGRTSQNVEALEVLTYDGLRMAVGPTSDEELERIIAAGGRRGEIYAALRDLRDRYGDLVRERFPDIPRRVAGYNLDALLPEHGFDVARALVGSEGTCVTVLQARVRLIAEPPEVALLVLGYPDVVAAGRAVAELLDAGPRGIEGFDHRLVEYARQEHLRLGGLALLPDAEAWLMVELGGESAQEAARAARELMARLRGRGGDAPSMRLLTDRGEQKRMWAVREAALGVTARLPDGTPTWTGWEDSAVAPERVGDYLRDLLALYDRYGYRAAVYGHFGDGCIHNRLDLDLRTREGVGRYRAFVTEAADLVVSHGGSISGEHGDGQSRAELLGRMYGEELVRAFEEFKAIWDPAGRMNPGKVVHPARLDEHLRIGPGWRPEPVQTIFAFPDDGGDFAKATLRCVGVGTCRREEGGTMCPSYMATREERHSTRGRSRLLFEMLTGEVITDGWASEDVREALDLCLACKGCHSDCPVSVDMATYKAEFLAHHYAGRLRPAAHYTMGWLPLSARLAARAPALVNALTHAPGLAGMLKRAGGIAPQREIPRFARGTLRHRFAKRGTRRAGGRPVVLWPDTFTNHLDPRIGEAAVEVLEDAGFTVRLTDSGLCCGLTWISTGQLAIARRVLARAVRALDPAARAGVRVVGLEPSCTAVFRHDLGQLFPDWPAARRVSEAVVTLAELLSDQDGWTPRSQPRRAIVQAHCHQRAVLSLDADLDLLGAAGVEAELLDSGCCGLAGNFGFERGHHDVSMACAERVLLPAVRSAAPDTLVLADGFSCRTQIEQATGRRALHLAEAMTAPPRGAPRRSRRRAQPPTRWSGGAGCTG
jgi:FAD/FMN-containing dehydrogenase/Fe-S oxidoreductase